MNAGHRTFEIRCALALSGALDEREFAELDEHVKECGDCRRRLDEAMWMDCQLAMVRERAMGRLRAPKGMMERFAIRAGSEGIPLKQRRHAAIPRVALGALAVAVLSVLPFAIKPRDRDLARHAAPVAAALAETPGHSALSSGDPSTGRGPGKMRSSHRSGVRRYMRGVGSPFGFRDAPGDGTAAGFRLAAISSLPANPRPRLAFVSVGAGSSCDGDRPVSSLPDLNPEAAPGRRVFCYNPRIASLTSLDLFHAAATNGPQLLDESLEFRWTRGGP